MKVYYQLLFAILSVASIQSCLETEFISMDSEQIEEASLSQLCTKTSLPIFYHEDTGFLIQEHEDPYIAKEGMKVTHRAIEFRPKSMEEYNNLLSYSDKVFISYIPFGFSPVREASEGEIGYYDPFPIGNKYYVSHSVLYEDSSQNEDYMKVSLPDDSKIPDLYIVWPIDLSIPESIEHIVQYDVSLPMAKSDGQKSNRFEGTGQINLPITINTYDTFINTYVPMTGIKVRVSNGSFNCDYYMNSNGSATIQPLMFAADLTLTEISQLQVYVIYQTSKFTVSRNTAVTPIQKYLGTVSSLWGPMSYNTTFPTYISHQSSVTNECEIFQGAYYYYYGTHNFSSLISSSELGIIIHADTSQPGMGGQTFFYSNIPTIYIYNEAAISSDCIASVNHEIGHVHHYCINSNFSMIQDSLLRESFASYVGWYVGETYYFSKGYVKPYPGYTINMQDRQEWTTTSPFFIDEPEMYYYSPLFVDLTDDYNQTIITDTISDVPVSVINSMGALCTTVTQCMSYLLSYVGTYFTSSELITYFSYYL